jgi:hypothetical protein
MIILKSNLSGNVAVIYDKTGQESYLMMDIKNNDTGLIEKIMNSSKNQKGIIYYTGK